MEFYEATSENMTKGYTDTARRLLDSLVAYRSELGETGRQLELLLRLYGVMASTDVTYSRRIH